MVRLTEPRMMCMSDPTAPPFWEAVLRMMCSSYNGTSLLRGRPTYGVTDRPTYDVQVLPSFDPHSTIIQPSNPHSTLIRPSFDPHSTLIRPSFNPPTLIQPSFNLPTLTRHSFDPGKCGFR